MQYNKLVAYVTREMEGHIKHIALCDTDSMHYIPCAIMHNLAALLFLQIICVLAQCAAEMQCTVLHISVLVSGRGEAVDLGREAQMKRFVMLPYHNMSRTFKYHIAVMLNDISLYCSSPNR